MANSLDAYIPEVWSRRVQKLLKRKAVFYGIANFEERATLTKGDKVHRPRPSDFSVNDYTRNTDVTLQDITTADEFLTVDQSKEVSFSVDELDNIQSLYDIAETHQSRAAYRLGNEMDGTFLAQVSNANNTFTDGNMATATNGGGTAGIKVSTTNAVEMISRIKASMNQADIEADAPWDLVLDPVTASSFEQQVVSNGFNTADNSLRNGYAGDMMGFSVFISNNLKHTVVSTATGNVSADDTYTVAGVVFTFKAAPAVAGEVDLGSDAETSLANLTAAINGAAGAGTTYIEVSGANRQKLTNNKVSAVATATTITVTSAGSVSVSESLTNVTNGDTIISALAEKRASIDMVIQAMPTAQMNKIPLQTGYYHITYDLYGVKTFTEGADRMFNVSIVGK